MGWGLRTDESVVCACCRAASDSEVGGASPCVGQSCVKDLVLQGVLNAGRFAQTLWGGDAASLETEIEGAYFELCLEGLRAGLPALQRVEHNFRLKQRRPVSG